MSQKDVGIKVPIYKLKKTEEVMKYYIASKDVNVWLVIYEVIK